MFHSTGQPWEPPRHRRPPSTRQARDTIECHEPATRRPLGTIAVDGPATVRTKVAAARLAQDQWKASSFRARRRVLERVKAHLVEHADALVELICRDSGKTRENALMGEIWPVCEKLRWTIANGERHLKAERVSSGMFPHKRARTGVPPAGRDGRDHPLELPTTEPDEPRHPRADGGQRGRHQAK